jgi:hypothetical protein
MARARPSLWLCLPALLALGSAPARAEDTSQDAAQDFARGKRLFDDHQYVEAIAAFEKAYKAAPHHAVQCSIAHCYEQLNRFVEAARHFKRCLDEGASRTARAPQVRRSLAAAEARFAWVQVTSPRPGCSVHVDGRAVGAPPSRVPLDPGRHVVEVRRPGAQPASMELQLLASEQRAISLTPIDLPGETPATRSVTEPPSTRPEPAPVGRRRLHPGWFWAGVALTAALTGATVAMGVLTMRARSDYYDAPTKQGYDDFVQRRLITNILTGLLVGSGVTTTVLFFYTDFAGRSRSETGGTTAGLGLRGTF